MTDSPWIPLFLPNPSMGIERYTDLWLKFAMAEDGAGGSTSNIRERIKKWKGKIINDVVVFDTEQDKMWFLLRWS